MIKHLYRMASTVFGILKAGDVLIYMDKLVSNGDGTYKKFASLELPFGLTKTRKFILVSDPEMIREVLHQDASLNSPSSPFSLGWIGETFAKELGEILFVLSHEDHALLRQSMSLFFRQHVDKRFGANLYMSANALIDAWLKKGKADVSEDLNYFSSQMIIDHFIGYVEDPRRLYNATKAILANLERVLKVRSPLSDKKMEKARQTIAEISLEACKRSSDGSSLLKVLYEAKDTEGKPLFSQSKIEGMVRFLFLAGQVTVGSVLPALLHHCTEEFQYSVRAEWAEKPRSVDSLEDVLEFAKKSKWIQALLNEALRLFPPAYGVSRECIEDTQIGDLSVPRGTTVSLLFILAQKDIRYWGPNAKKFHPERWFHINAEEKVGPFMPFGVGPNNCLGQAFARLEIGVLLTLFCLRMKWSSAGSYRPITKLALSSQKDVILSIAPAPSLSVQTESTPTKESKCPFSHLFKN